MVGRMLSQKRSGKAEPFPSPVLSPGSWTEFILNPPSPSFLSMPGPAPGTTNEQRESQRRAAQLSPGAPCSSKLIDLSRLLRCHSPNPSHPFYPSFAASSFLAKAVLTSMARVYP